MQTILLIRHAKALDPNQWDQPDHLRPLTTAGMKQARAIADELGTTNIRSIRTSPAVRCVQTVQPLAEQAGVELEIDDTLMEGRLIHLPDAHSSGLHILCAHSDNILALLEHLNIDWQECRKGSIWMLKRDDAGDIVDVSYVPPA